MKNGKNGGKISAELKSVLRNEGKYVVGAVGYAPGHL